MSKKALKTIDCQAIDFNKILATILEAEKEEKSLIWMIPSENSISRFAKLASSSGGQNRYLFKYYTKDNEYQFGTKKYNDLAEYCIEMLQKLLNAKYVSLAPLSGMNAMSMVIGSFTSRDGTTFGIPVKCGGHTHTKHIVDFMGRVYREIPFRDYKGWYDVDSRQLSKDIISENIGDVLIYLDPMTYPYTFNLKAIRKFVPKESFLYYDISHVMGLIAGGVYDNPLENGFDAIGGSLHKTFPGVQKAIFLTNEEEHFNCFKNKGEQLVSSKHTHSIVALAITLAEIEGKVEKYAKNIIKNNNALHQQLCQYGFSFYGKDSSLYDGHILLLKRSNLAQSIDDANKLYQAGLVVHPMLMPVGNKIAAGIRLGVQECTVLGMGVDDMVKIADIFHNVLNINADTKKIKKESEKLLEYRRFPKFSNLNSQKFDELFHTIFY